MLSIHNFIKKVDPLTFKRNPNEAEIDSQDLGNLLRMGRGWKRPWIKRGIWRPYKDS